MDHPAPLSLSVPDGRSLNVWLAGPEEGTPLLFHAGTPGSGIPYIGLVSALVDHGLRYVAFSRPGYGSSTRLADRRVAGVVPDSLAVLDYIGADKAYVLGSSGGGPHALACAALMPNRVLGTALIGCVAPSVAVGLDWMAGMGAENVEEFGAALAGPESLRAFMEQAWPLFSSITGPQVAEALGDLVDDVDRASIRGDFADWFAASVRDGLSESYWGWFDDDMAFTRPWGFDTGRIAGPVHVWHGGHDRMVPISHGEWLARHVGGACPHLHEEHGHLTLAVDSLSHILDEVTGGLGD